MTCQQNSATICWLAILKELEEWLRKCCLIPTLVEGVIYHFQKWRDSTFVEVPPPLSIISQTLVDLQAEIGWYKELFGLFNKR